MAQLPTLGRGALLCQRLSGLGNPGWKKVLETTEFMAGMVVAQDSDGLIYRCDDSAQPVGLALGSKITAFYNPVVNEEVTFDTLVQNLAHANVQKVLVTNTSTGLAYTVTTDYTISAVNGTITRVALGSIAEDETVHVSYLYADPNKAGMDETLPTGLISIANNQGEISNLVYDTSNIIAVGDSLKCDADGFLSTDSSLTGKDVGYVTVAPTSDKPALVFMLDIEY